MAFISQWAIIILPASPPAYYSLIPFLSFLSGRCCFLLASPVGCLGSFFVFYCLVTSLPSIWASLTLIFGCWARSGWTFMTWVFVVMFSAHLVWNFSFTTSHPPFCRRFSPGSAVFSVWPRYLSFEIISFSIALFSTPPPDTKQVVYIG